MSDQREDAWNGVFEQMNDVMADSIEKNIEAQTAMIESMTGSMDESMPEDDLVAEGMQGYVKAYDVWMDAAEEMFDRTADATQGEEVDPAEFRDIWLRSANEAFSEVMSTSAFASANGQLIEQVMEMQQEVDDMTQDSLAQMGLATRDDVEEVGERLVELERRQHTLETKLDDLIEAVESLGE